MSIHAQLTPEAQAALAAQKRNSTISAVIIAVISFGLVILILMVIALTVAIKNPPDIISYPSAIQKEQEIQRSETSNQVQRKPSAPAASMSKVIASTNASANAVPIANIDIGEVNVDYGIGNDFGQGWGDDSGAGFGGNSFSALPTTMKKRCTESARMKMMNDNGGSRKCEDAVVKALRWLQDNQKEDGSWDHIEDSNKYRVAMTGFALLAYLGHCESPKSAEFGKTVNTAILYLLDVGMKNNGKLSLESDKHWPYEHAIATYALAEAYTFCKSLNIEIPNLDTVTKKAGDIILEGQSSSGSWVYDYRKDGGDNSVGYWQIQAVKACRLSKLWINDTKFKKCYKAAKEWFTRVQGTNGAYGYRDDPRQNPGLTGGGVLCLQIMGFGESNQAKLGTKYVYDKLEGLKFEKNRLYHHYYDVQAMMNVGGKEWDKYNNFFRDEVLALQREDGSWKNIGNKQVLNEVMTTCLFTFMLEVYYRFLPSAASKS